MPRRWIQQWTTIPRAGGRACYFGTAPGVSFVIRALVDDGLHSAPFVIHPQHVGPLQRAGLDDALWNRWLQSVASRFEALYDYVGSPDLPTAVGGGVLSADMKTLERLSSNTLNVTEFLMPWPQLARLVKRQRRMRFFRRGKGSADSQGWVSSNHRRLISLVPPGTRVLDIPYAGSVAVLVGSRTILCGQPVSGDEELMISEIDRLAGLIQP